VNEPNEGICRIVYRTPEGRSRRRSAGEASEIQGQTDTMPEALQANVPDSNFSFSHRSNFVSPN